MPKSITFTLDVVIPKFMAASSRLRSSIIYKFSFNSCLRSMVRKIFSFFGISAKVLFVIICAFLICFNEVFNCCLYPSVELIILRLISKIVAFKSFNFGLFSPALCL